jgi:hypothetical protein
VSGLCGTGRSDRPHARAAADLLHQRMPSARLPVATRSPRSPRGNAGRPRRASICWHSRARIALESRFRVSVQRRTGARGDGVWRVGPPRSARPMDPHSLQRRLLRLRVPILHPADRDPERHDRLQLATATGRPVGFVAQRAETLSSTTRSAAPATASSWVATSTAEPRSAADRRARTTTSVKPTS